MTQLDLDRDAYNTGRYGDYAVENFRNLIDQSLSNWQSNFNTDWANAGQGVAPRWYDKVGPPDQIMGLSSQPQPIYDKTFFDPLINQARTNYTSALSYANALSPDVGSAFLAALTASERGGIASKLSKGQGQPTAYMGDLGRVGGWQEIAPTQELANIFPDNHQGGFSGVRS